MGSQAWDDITGEELVHEAVIKARGQEMQYIGEKQVWELITRQEAVNNGWKIIKTRWIDTDKGDKKSPNYRSRLVAKEFNDGAQEGLFAPTPPLEAFKLLLSDAATITDGGRHEPKVIMINDVARAFFEAPARRPVCVEILREAGADGTKVGKLRMSLYGARDAAANVQEEVKKFMIGCGFARATYNPSLYWHKDKDLRTLVHGDDFVTSGAEKSSEWFRQALEDRFEIKTKIVGHREGLLKEARVLNRVVRADPQGWEYEPDQRHMELIVKGLGLENAKAVRAPGEDEKSWEEEDNAKSLNTVESQKFRSIAARCNYLAPDSH